MWRGLTCNDGGAAADVKSSKIVAAHPLGEGAALPSLPWQKGKSARIRRELPSRILTDFHNILYRAIVSAVSAVPPLRIQVA